MLHILEKRAFSISRAAAAALARYSRKAPISMIGTSVVIYASCSRNKFRRSWLRMAVD
jgi:hypothetical protein